MSGDVVADSDNKFFYETGLQKFFTDPPALVKHPVGSILLPVSLAVLPAIHPHVTTGWFVCACIVFVLIVLLHLAFLLGEQWRKKKAAEMEKNALIELQKNYELEISKLLDELNISLVQVLDVGNRADKKRNHDAFVGARKAIVVLVRNQLGSTNGVRVNHFEVDQTQTKLIPVSNRSSVGGERISTRIFTENDETFNLACKGQSRLETDTSNLDEDELPYETFVTAPIIAGNRLYGLLTVDSEKKGDLGEFDKSLLIHFASQMAVTYTYESSQAFYIELNGHGTIESEHTTHQGDLS
ncbi:hypothetical protein CFELI_13030 [Corynebacterium felinum]|nr:hypothetical protein CFELI_13030 [Corynebacterium felinum]